MQPDSRRLTLNCWSFTMSTCYLCGCHLAKGAGIRRKVKVAESSGMSFGRSLRTYSSVTRALRTVCPACAQRLDQQREERRRFERIVIIGVVVVVTVVAVTIGVLGLVKTK